MSITSIPFKLTNTGKSNALALVSGATTLKVTHIQIGSGSRAPDGTEVALTASGSQTEYIAINSQVTIEPAHYRISSAFPGTALSFNIQEIGLWSGVPGASNSVLVFYWSQTSGPIAVKSANIYFNFETDIIFGDATVNITIDAAGTGSMVQIHNADNQAHPQFATKVGVQGAVYSSANAGGSANAISAAYTPEFIGSTLVNGATLLVRAAYANTTVTPTFTPNFTSVAPRGIVKGNNLALVAGDISGAGHWLELQYDLALDRWVLQNPAKGIKVWAEKGINTDITSLSSPEIFSATATTQANNDNSTKVATTAWIRNAMSNIASAAGFLFSYTETNPSNGNGYVVFPSWLGSLKIQWQLVNPAASPTTNTYSFPIAFTNFHYGSACSYQDNVGDITSPVTYQKIGLTTFNIRNMTGDGNVVFVLSFGV